MVINKNSLFSSESIFWRQLDIVKMGVLKNTTIIIIGVGSIGSFTALSLAKMGVGKLILYDDDTVDGHNLPNQFFKVNDMGKLKVQAVAENVLEMMNTNILLNGNKFKEQKLEGLVISAVDSMKTRKEIWQRVKFNPNIDLYIDGRMGGQVFRIYSIRPTDPDGIKIYEENLYDDEEATQERCTDKAIIYNVLGVSSLICNNVKKFINGENISKEIMFDYVNIVCQTA